jgi:DNA helicase-2/ATP-dependent DNA helicase PcrA
MKPSDLNPAQKQAVMHDDGPMLVVAGAGTGKTHVITTRIARLIEEGKAEPSQILALTFTEKAAGEMLDRLDTMIGWQAYQVNVMTFHAFGVQLLQRFGHHLGWSTRTEVIPDLAKLLLLKQNLGRVELSYYGPQNDILDFLQVVLDFITALQNADIDIKSYREFVEGLKPSSDWHALDIDEQHDMLKLFELYEALKRELGVIDYHDQVQLPLQLLQQKPNIAETLRAEYRYVLVDEYQDTNAAQDALLRAIVPKGGNIFAVGDDDQAIYGFRGAKLDNILNFATNFGVSEPLALTENYRSSQQILDRAYKMIQHNDPERLEVRLGINKKLHAQTEATSPEFRPFLDARAEADGVATELATRIEAGEEPSTIAVLATSHAFLKNLARILRQKHVPHQLSSNVNIFEQPEMVQLWHLLRWIGMEARDEAVAQVLLGPFVSWTSDRVRRVIERSSEELTTLETALESMTDDPGAAAIVKLLGEWRGWAKDLSVSQLCYRLIFDTEIKQRWIDAAPNTPRMVRVFEDLQVWMQHMLQFESVALDPTLAGYLGEFPKPPEIASDELVGDEGGVALLTIHASKGLEFNTVIIMNNTQEAWGERSTGRRVQLPDGLVQSDTELPPEHERRRLLYVAMTRAKQNLIMTLPLRQAGGRVRKPSPYLAEIFEPPELGTLTGEKTNGTLEESLQKLQRYAPPLLAEMPKRLPLEDVDGWLTLSTSDLDLYDNCPYEFYLEKVLKIRLPLGPQASFGSLLHALFHDYYASRQSGDPFDLSQLNDRLHDSWSSRGYATEEEATRALAVAAATLASFYQREESEKRQLRSSEEPFVLTMEDAKLKIRGRIDATFTDGDEVEVRDFKTGRARDAEKLSEKAKTSLQLRTYALAIEQMTGKPARRVVLDYIVTGTEGVGELTDRVLANHRTKLAEIADKIRAREFEPKRDLFHKCIATRYWGDPEDERDA